MVGGITELVYANKLAARRRGPRPVERRQYPCGFVTQERRGPEKVARGSLQTHPAGITNFQRPT